MLDLGERESIYQPEQKGLKFPYMPKSGNTARNVSSPRAGLSPCITWTMALPAT
jgi:hypothetical protein